MRVWSEEESCEVSERMSTSTAALQYLLKFQENVVHRARRTFHNRDEVLTVPVDLTRRERVRGRGRSTGQSVHLPRQSWCAQGSQQLLLRQKERLLQRWVAGEREDCGVRGLRVAVCVG